MPWDGKGIRKGNSASYRPHHDQERRLFHRPAALLVRDSKTGKLRLRALDSLLSWWRYGVPKPIGEDE
jgi:hypothetical protein